jgi:hypothetical protein
MLEEQIEEAFWDFDGRRKGYGEWKNRPQSERDAFKSVLRTFIERESKFSDAKPLFPYSRIIEEGDTAFCQVCGSGWVFSGGFWNVRAGCRNPECKNYHNIK